MLNVIEFREKASRSGGSRRQRAPASVGAGISELASSIIEMQSKANGEIGNAILMLDLAAQHARLIARQIGEPSARNDFDDHIAIIDRLLQTARELALKL
jgi:hypothetical protein